MKRHHDLAGLVDEALALEDRLAGLEAAHRISARGLMNTSMVAAGCTLEDVIALERRIDADPEAYPHSVTFLHKAVRLLADTTITINQPLSPRRMIGVMPQVGLDAIRGEGSDLRLLWALAVHIAGRKHPGAFGAVDDMASHQAEVEAARSALHELYRRIEQYPLVLGEDVIVSMPTDSKMRSDGLRLCTYRIAPTTPLGSPAGHIVAEVRKIRFMSIAAE